MRQRSPTAVSALHSTRCVDHFIGVLDWSFFSRQSIILFVCQSGMARLGPMPSSVSKYNLASASV